MNGTVNRIPDDPLPEADLADKDFAVAARHLPDLTEREVQTLPDLS
jgi:hypothetical protein